MIFFALSCIANIQTSPFFDDGLIERETSEDTLFKREFADIDARNNLRGWFPEPERRGGREANPTKKEGKNKPVAPARPVNQLQKREKAKYTMGPSARNELDGMKLRGKVRDSAIKWQKNEVRKKMKSDPRFKKAETAVIK